MSAKKKFTLFFKKAVFGNSTCFFFYNYCRKYKKMWCVKSDEILSHSKLLDLNKSALHFPKSQYLLGILIFFHMGIYSVRFLYQNLHLFLDSVISFIISKSEKYQSYDDFLTEHFHDSSLSFKTHTPSKLLQLIRYFFSFFVFFYILQDSIFYLFFV